MIFMPKIKLRLQKVSDAKRFYEILNNPCFIYLTVRPKSVATEREMKDCYLYAKVL